MTVIFSDAVAENTMDISKNGYTVIGVISLYIDTLYAVYPQIFRTYENTLHVVLRRYNNTSYTGNVPVTAKILYKKE